MQKRKQKTRGKIDQEKTEGRWPDHATFRNVVHIISSYQQLGESGDVHKKSTIHNNSKHTDPIGDLDEWEKLRR